MKNGYRIGELWSFIGAKGGKCIKEGGYKTLGVGGVKIHPRPPPPLKMHCSQTSLDTFLETPRNPND